MLQEEVAVAISNIKVHKDDMPTEVLSPAEQESHLRNRLNIHLTEVGKSFKEADYVDLNPYIDDRAGDLQLTRTNKDSDPSGLMYFEQMCGWGERSRI